MMINIFAKLRKAPSGLENLGIGQNPVVRVACADGRGLSTWMAKVAIAARAEGRPVWMLSRKKTDRVMTEKLQGDPDFVFRVLPWIENEDDADEVVAREVASAFEFSKLNADRRPLILVDKMPGLPVFYRMGTSSLVGGRPDGVTMVVCEYRPTPAFGETMILFPHCGSFPGPAGDMTFGLASGEFFVFEVGSRKLSFQDDDITRSDAAITARYPGNAA